MLREVAALLALQISLTNVCYADVTTSAAYYHNVVDTLVGYQAEFEMRN